MPVAQTPFEAIGNTLLDSFLKTKKGEFEAFQAKAEEEGRVAGHFRQLKDKVENSRNTLQVFIERLDFIRSVDIGKSLLERARNNTGDILTIDQHAPEFLSAYLTKILEPDLRKIAKADHEKLEAEWAKLLSENDAILRRLKLV